MIKLVLAHEVLKLLLLFTTYCKKRSIKNIFLIFNTETYFGRNIVYKNIVKQFQTSKIV